MPNVKKSLTKNWDSTKEDDFVDKSVAELKRVGAKVCRVHVAGDLYSVEYAQKWLAIFKALPECRFFIYTRSWRGAEFKTVMSSIAKCKNVRLWLSVDKETGKPKRVPKGARLAYMQVAHDDVPKYKVDLVFRTDNLKDVVAKKVGNATVCPVENGATRDMNCMKCGICWRDKGEQFDWTTVKTRKTALPMLAA
jgi:hypothetical protein